MSAPDACALVTDLAKIGSDEIRHLYQGKCPDGVEGPDVRDPNCPACILLVRARRWLAAPPAPALPSPVVRRGAPAYARNWHRKGNPWERGTVEDATYRDANPEGVWSYTVRLDRPSKRGGPIRIVTSHDSANIRAAETVPVGGATRAEAGRIGGQRSAAKRARVAT